MIDSYYVQVNKTKRDIPLGSKNSNINTKAGVFPNTLIPTVSTWIQQVSNHLTITERKIPSLYCLYFLCIVYFVLKVLRFESTFRTES